MYPPEVGWDGERIMSELPSVDTSLEVNARDAAHVLVVDDEPDVADLYADFLPETYTVEVAHGGREALQMMSEAVDVVLLDRRMPDLSGDEVLERIREDGYQCRVAMVTAVDPMEEIVEMPFDDYVIKPADAEAIAATVDRLHLLRMFQQVYFALSSARVKRDVLEEEYDGTRLEASDQYDMLVRRIQALERLIRSIEVVLEDDYDTTPKPE